MIETPFLQLTASAEGAEAGSNVLLLIMIAVLALFMVFTFRRGRKVREQQREAHSNAVPGAEVIMAGGVVGTVVNRDEENQRITLEFSSGHRADFLIAAVQQVAEPATSTETDETN